MLLHNEPWCVLLVGTSDFQSSNRPEKITYLQILTHLLRNDTQANTREVVDREPRILRVIHRDHSFAELLYFRILKPLRDSLYTHRFDHLLEHDLDEDATTASRLVFIHLNH